MSDTLTNKFCLVLSNFPNQTIAETMAEVLVNKQLAACVNILAPCTSIYHWQGKLHQDQEVPVIIKTREELVKQVEQAILEHHPYELPEIISVPIGQGYSPYLEWLLAQTSTPSS